MNPPIPNPERKTMNTLPTLEQIRIMNTRPTPETDKFFATFADGEAAPSHAEYYARLQDLERERDEAREALKTGGMFDIIDRAIHDRAAAIRQRDEVWKKYDLEAVENMLAVNKIRHERDEAREQRDRLAAVLQNIRNDYGWQVADPDCGCVECEFLLPIDKALQSLTPNETISNQ